MTIDVQELRMLAERATNGLWRWNKRRLLNGGGITVLGYDTRYLDCHPTPQDSRYIVAAQPRNILSLLDRLAAAEAECAAMRELAERLIEGLGATLLERLEAAEAELEKMRGK